jgi:NTE family protein
MTDVALALGGGGIKGIAHVGVIRQLEKSGFNIKAIAGTSAGGMVGSVYAAGHRPETMVRKITATSRSNLFLRLSGDGPSLLGLQGVAKLLIEMLGDIEFKDLSIPFACTAVNIKTDQEVILTEGRVVDAVLSTIAIPGVFPPKELGGLTLIDGAVMDPVPVALARWLAPELPVIAVCLSPEPEKWAHLPSLAMVPQDQFTTPLLETLSKLRYGQAMSIFIRSIDITSRMLAEMRLKIDKPDVLIRPNLEKYSLLQEVNPDEVDELIEIGEAATELIMPELRHVSNFPHWLSRRFRKPLLPGKKVRIPPKET